MVVVLADQGSIDDRVSDGATQQGPDGDASRSSEFEDIVVGEMDMLYGVALRLTRNPEDAEDLAQDACERALKFSDKFNMGSYPKAWLLTILRNIFINDYRKNVRRPVVVEYQDNVASSTADNSPFPDPNRGETREQDWDDFYLRNLEEVTVRILKSMPSGHEQVMRLRHFGGLSYEEIAEALDIPIGTVMSRLSRGKYLFKGEYARLAEDDPALVSINTLVGFSAVTQSSQGPNGNALPWSSKFQDQVLGLRNRLYEAALELTENHEDAMDLVQSTYVDALRYYRKTKSGYNVEAWLYKTLKENVFNSDKEERLEVALRADDYSAAIDKLSLQLYNQEQAQIAEQYLDVWTLDFFRVEVGGILENMKPQLSAMVRMRYMEDMIYREMGEASNNSESTVRFWLFEGIKLLSEAYIANNGNGTNLGQIVQPKYGGSPSIWQIAADANGEPF